MAIYTDLSGNTPQADSDFRIGGHEDLQAINFRGTETSFTLSGTAQNSAPFSRRCRAIRITTEDECTYAVGPTAVAVAGSNFLPDNAVEIIKVRFGDRFSVLQNGAVTGNVTIKEDLS